MPVDPRAEESPGATVDPIEALSRRLGALCLDHDVYVTAAESCTGGGVAAAITDIAGSSAYFETGYVTYANGAKRRLLGVSAGLLDAHGAVSREVVEAMVGGACADSGARFGVAVSGVAGPGGGTPAKPVGTVWFAWADGERTWAECHHLAGDRQRVRRQAVVIALEGLIARLSGL